MESDWGIPPSFQDGFWFGALNPAQCAGLISDAPSEQPDFPPSSGLPNFSTRSRVGSMKPRVSNQKTSALTLVEVLVVIAVLFVLAALLLPAISDHPRGAPKAHCLNNLKQIAVANLVWAGNHNDKFPMQVSVTNGGTKELAADGRNAWLNFLVLSNELVTPRILWCPADKERVIATNFSGLYAKNISYFIGLDAVMHRPRWILSGDDSFAIGGVPVKSGLLAFSTNAPINWTAARHNNWGNIVRADGSAESTSSSTFKQMLVETGVATNRLAIP